MFRHLNLYRQIYVQLIIKNHIVGKIKLRSLVKVFLVEFHMIFSEIFLKLQILSGRQNVFIKYLYFIF